MFNSTSAENENYSLHIINQELALCQGGKDMMYVVRCL